MAWNDLPPADPMEPYPLPPMDYGPVGLSGDHPMAEAPGLAPEMAPQFPDTSGGFWSRLGAAGPIAIPHGGHDTGLSVLLSLLAGFANQKGAMAAGEASQTEKQNQRLREAAATMATRRHEMRRLDEAQRRAQENIRLTAKMRDKPKTLDEIKAEARARAEGTVAGGMSPEGLAQIEAKAEASARGGRKGAPPMASPQPLGTQLNAITDNIRSDPDVKDFITVRDNYKRVLESAKSRTGQGDLGVIFAYMKVLDPTSVVREAEFNNAAEAIGKLPMLQTVPRRWLQGDRLTDSGRQGFINETRKLYNAKKANHDTAVSFYKKQATALGIDPSLVVRDYTTGAEGGGAGLGGNQPSPGRIRVLDDKGNPGTFPANKPLPPGFKRL